MNRQARLAVAEAPTVSMHALRADDAQDWDLSDPRCRQYFFIHSGHGAAEVDGWKTEIGPGDILFIPSGSHATVRLAAGQAMRIGIEEEFLLSRVVPALGVAISDYWRDFHSPKKLSHWVRPEDERERIRLWQELTLAAGRLGLSCDATVAAYVILMMFEKNNRASHADGAAPIQVANAVDELPASALDLVSRFRGLIAEHLSANLQIRDYCQLLGTAPVYLTQACKIILGCTPAHVVHDQKLLHAKRQLIYSRSSAADIAYQIGFNDPAYFSRFFRRYVGQSPVEFRRKPREDGGHSFGAPSAG